MQRLHLLFLFNIKNFAKILIHSCNLLVKKIFGKLRLNVTTILDGYDEV